MPERELLGDHAAHRDAHDVGALPAERVEQRGGVLGEVGDRERIVHARAAPDAAVVVADDVEALQGLQERVAPREVRPAHALDEQQRLPGAAPLVEELEPVDREVRHGPGP
jgi:hypothetical protein